MNAMIREFSHYPPADLYALFRDVYSSSDAMSETLEEKYPDMRAVEEDLAALRRLPGAIALIAEVAGAPAGFLTIRPRRPARLRHAADLNFGVAPAARGQGLGRRLLEAGLERARATPGLEIISLMVRADNAPAIHLYQTAGFETLAVLKRDTKIGPTYHDGLLMRLRV